MAAQTRGCVAYPDRQHPSTVENARALAATDSILSGKNPVGALASELRKNPLRLLQIVEGVGAQKIPVLHRFLSHVLGEKLRDQKPLFGPHCTRLDIAKFFHRVLQLCPHLKVQSGVALWQRISACRIYLFFVFEMADRLEQNLAHQSLYFLRVPVVGNGLIKLMHQGA